MKAEWQFRPLGDVCKTGSGGTPLKSKKDFYENGTIPWLMSGEVSQGEVHKATKFITKKGLEGSSARIFPINTVLIAMYGATAGQVGILKFEASTNQAVCGVLPNDQFIPEFLYYFFLSKQEELISQATGNAQPNISQIKIKNTPVPIIGKGEQQRIVAILDEAFEQIAIVRANTEKNLQNARALFESHLKSALTTNTNDWKVGVLGDVCEELFAGGDVPKENSSKIKSGKFNIPIFTNGEKNMGLYGFTNSPRVTLPSITVSARGTIGYSEIRNEPFYPAIRLIVLTPKTDVLDLFFLKALIRNMDFIHSGTSIPQLTVPMIKEYPIKYPTLDVQKQLVKKLDKLNEQTQHLESLYQRKLNALDALKKSLLHKAFAGEL
jgi:type I restriction enzyme S subunit